MEHNVSSWMKWSICWGETRGASGDDTTNFDVMLALMAKLLEWHSIKFSFLCVCI